MVQESNPVPSSQQNPQGFPVQALFIGLSDQPSHPCEPIEQGSNPTIHIELAFPLHRMDSSVHSQYRAHISA